VPLALTLLQVVAGTGQMLIVVASQTYVSSLGSGQQRAHHLSIYAFAISAGQLAGPILGGALADTLGFRPAFLISGLVALFPLAAALFLPDTLPPAVRRERRNGALPTLSKLKELLQNDGIKAAILVSFAVIFTMGVRRTFLPLYLSELGFSATTIGFILSARALAAMAVRPWMGTVIALLGRRQLLLASMLAGALSILLIPAWPAFGPLTVLAVLGGVGTGFSQPLTLLSVSDRTGDNERGLALGLRMTGNRLALFTNPLVFGFVAEYGGLEVAFVAAGLLLTTTTLLLLRWQQFSVTDSEPTDGVGRTSVPTGTPYGIMGRNPPWKPQ